VAHESARYRRQEAPGPLPGVPRPPPDGGNVLIDTGSIRRSPQILATTSAGCRSFVTPELETGEDIPAQLRTKGIDPREIRAVVMTHLTSTRLAMSEFATRPSSSASRVGRRDAGSRPLLRGYIPAQYDLLFDYLDGRLRVRGRGGVD